MKTVTIYTTSYCPYCSRAKMLLDTLNVPYQEVDVEHDQEKRQELVEKYQWQTVPAIFVEDELIGGYDDLVTLHTKGIFLPKISE